MIINILNSDNSIIINIKTQNHQIMTTITDITSKLELAKHTFADVVIFSRIISLAYISSIVIQSL